MDNGAPPGSIAGKEYDFGKFFLSRTVHRSSSFMEELAIGAYDYQKFKEEFEQIGEYLQKKMSHGGASYGERVF
jgi:hypothetical protein